MQNLPQPDSPGSSYISRWVAFLILPFVTAIATLVSTKAKAWFGVDLDPAEVVAFVLATAGGIAVWLYNRGKFEVAHATGLNEETVEGIVDKVIETRLPPPPTSQTDPGAGSPASPRAPGL